MNVPKKPRRRAVRLTPEALARLRGAVEERWRRTGARDRLTREARMEILGVNSVSTADKVWSNAGADRSTLELAFWNLAMEWDDVCCEYVPITDQGTSVDTTEAIEATETVETIEAVEVVETVEAVEAVENASRTTADSGNLAVGSPVDAPERPTTFRLRGRRLALVTACLLGLVAWASFRHTTLPGPTERWQDAFDRTLKGGTSLYHRADYAGARLSLNRAVDLAKAHDSAGHLAAALRLQGDLSEAQGDLSGARDRYRAALDIRTTLSQEVTRPALLECLGEVETRLGERSRAKADLVMCLDGYKRLGDPIGQSLASRDLGNLAFRSGDFGAAERWFQRSLDDVRGRSKPDIEADVQGRIALVLLKRGRAVPARAALWRCLEYWTAKGHPRWIAVCQLRLGLAEASLGDRPAAIVWLTRSRAGFEGVRDEAGALEAVDGLRRLAVGAPRPSESVKGWIAEWR